MNDLSKKIISDYQIRKTKAQKTAFIDLLKEYYPDLKVEGGSFNRNIIIGDPKKAKVLLTAHYDTCARLPFPNFLTPKNVGLYILYSIIVCIPFLLLGFFSTRFLFWLNDHTLMSETVVAFIPLISSVLYFSIIIYVFLLAPANKHTLNDNTSGVVTLTELLEVLKDREEVAFIFFDNEENGLIGSSLYRKNHKEEVKDQFLINFDCVSDGDYLMMILDKKIYEKEKDRFEAIFRDSENKYLSVESSKDTFYPSDQGGYPNAAGVAAFNKGKRIGYYVDKIHTDKDRVFDEVNIEVLRTKTIELCEILIKDGQ